MLTVGVPSSGQDIRRAEGYTGIWFDLGQRSEYGPKYSGGFATYPAKHRPLAIYSAEANKTFFVYGGTTAPDERHLLAMVSYYDHTTHQVPRPVVVHDKQGVNDPHDNPSIAIDGQGYVWVLVSGRGQRRPGFRYRSQSPYSIDGFDLVSEEEFTYPQCWWMQDEGFFFLFTKYTKGRELYWRTSDAKASEWSKATRLAGMGGHYQTSYVEQGEAFTMFNRHPKGNVDRRTDLYFVRSADRGKTWTTVDGTPLELPLTDPDSPALVHKYSADKRLVYVKDLRLDAEGRPVLLYVTSSGHQPGPENGPREWKIAHWREGAWAIHTVTTSTHNYDLGALYIEPNEVWRVIAPTEVGPQQWGAGGLVADWRSTDQGATWKRTQTHLPASKANHGYARHPLNASDDFYAFWSDGNPDQLSPCRIYFTNKKGNKVWRLPTEMAAEFATPDLMEQHEQE